MAGVLITSSKVTCGHSGNVVVTSTQKLKVNSSAVLVKDSIQGKSIPDCQTIEPANDPSGTQTGKKCTSVSSVGSGEATKLKVNGQAVMLDTLSGTTNGMVAKITPQTLLAAEAKQTKLTAV